MFVNLICPYAVYFSSQNQLGRMVGPQGIDLRQAVLRTGGMVDFWAWVTSVEWWTDFRCKHIEHTVIGESVDQQQGCDEVQMIQVQDALNSKAELALILISVP